MQERVVHAIDANLSSGESFTHKEINFIEGFTDMLLKSRGREADSEIYISGRSPTNRSVGVVNIVVHINHAGGCRIRIGNVVSGYNIVVCAACTRVVHRERLGRSAIRIHRESKIFGINSKLTDQGGRNLRHNEVVNIVSASSIVGCAGIEINTCQLVGAVGVARLVAEWPCVNGHIVDSQRGRIVVNIHIKLNREPSIIWAGESIIRTTHRKSTGSAICEIAFQGPL